MFGFKKYKERGKEKEESGNKKYKKKKKEKRKGEWNEIKREK